MSGERQIARCAKSAILAILFVLSIAPLQAQEEEKKLPLPRFVSLRASEVNMRIGPGTEYEVSWIYRRKSMPVEILEEFSTWRKIRDWEGSEGWVHKNMLSGKRTAIVIGERRTIRRDPADSAKPRAYVEPGVIVTVEECQQAWCEIEAPGRIEGWLKRNEIWGVYANETIPQ